MHIYVSKVKLDLRRPGEALQFLGDYGTGISRISAHEGGEVAALSTRRLYPLPRRHYWYSFLVKAESNPGAIMRPDGLSQ